LGGFFLAMSGIHVGILSADPTTYEPFAEQALFSFVRDGWTDVFMAHPRIWALLLAVGEATIGTCLLIGGRVARAGWVLAIAFHVLLMLFGFGIWLYAIPALSVLVRGARHDWRGLQQRHRASPPGRSPWSGGSLRLDRSLRAARMRS
jgi:hypothetical protein